MDNATITMDILYLVYNKSSIHAKKNITRLCKETSYYFDRILHNDCMKAVMKEITPEKVRVFHYRSGNNGRKTLKMFDEKYEISQKFEFLGEDDDDDDFILYGNIKYLDISHYKRIFMLRLNDCIECMKKFNETNNFYEHCKKYEF